MTNLGLPKLVELQDFRGAKPNITTENPASCKFICREALDRARGRRQSALAGCVQEVQAALAAAQARGVATIE